MFSCNCHQESPKMVLDPTTKIEDLGEQGGPWAAQWMMRITIFKVTQNPPLQSPSEVSSCWWTPTSSLSFSWRQCRNKWLWLTLPIDLCSLQAIHVNAGLQLKTLLSCVWINAEYQNMRIVSRIVKSQLESVKPRRFLWCRRWWSTTFNSLVPFWPSLSQHWGTNTGHFAVDSGLQCLSCVCQEGGEDFGLELISKNQSNDGWKRIKFLGNVPIESNVSFQCFPLPTGCSHRTGWWFSALDPELGGLERDLWPCEARAEGGPRMRALLGETMIE